MYQTSILLRKSIVFLTILSFIGLALPARAQVLTLKEAIQTALGNYATLKAKANYVNASKAYVKQSQREYLPDLNVSFQQDYGTINGQSGPSYGYKGLSVASAGPSLEAQNWNAAFGALYLTNVNWDFFTFGRAKEKVKVSASVLDRDQNDLEQEKFQQQVRVAGAYLNLLAAQRFTQSQQNNLDRALALRNVVVTRVKNGLNAGVDSSLSNAEVSNAKISLTRAQDYEQEQANVLAQMMGIAPTAFTLDSLFLKRIPAAINDPSSIKPEDHPLLKYYKSRVAVSDEQAKYFHTFNYPTFSMFGVLQTKGSGFNYDYGQTKLDSYSSAYWDGVNPTRGNYLLGLGMVWNITNPLRIHQQVEAQKYTSKALNDEYELIDQRLRDQKILSETKIKNALSNYVEAPIQVKAASDGYLQKSVMYKNGLSNIVDVTQALYTLNRAETDRDIAYSNVWQALLLKAAASGDFGLFINEF